MRVTCSPDDLPSQHELMIRIMRLLADRGTPGPHRLENLVTKAFGRSLGSEPKPQQQCLGLQAVGELVARGYVAPGSDLPNNWYPYVHLSDLGRAVAEENDPAVYDLDGYLGELRAAVPELEEAALEYVSEAIQAFGRNLLRSATVMIGTASEILIQRLIEAWAKAVGGSEETRLRQTVENQSVARAFAEFRASFEQHKRRIDERRVKQDTLTVIEQVFHFIRLCRNDAGHAIGFEPPARPLVQAHLVVFRYYARRLYDVIGYLDDPGLMPYPPRPPLGGDTAEGNSVP